MMNGVGDNMWSRWLVEIKRFGHDKEEWLKTLLELPNGILSHDTFGRLFSILELEEF